LPTERPGPHIRGNAIEALRGGWDLVISHPPCTYLSNAGACRLYPTKGRIDEDRYRLGLAAKRFFMAFYSLRGVKLCIENPTPSSVFGMPEPTQVVQPWMFGHPYTKRTLLWLKGLERLVPTDVVDPIGPFVPSGTGRKNRSKYGSARRGDDAKNRSVTFQGLADAMAAQWG